MVHLPPLVGLSPVLFVYVHPVNFFQPRHAKCLANGPVRKTWPVEKIAPRITESQCRLTVFVRMKGLSDLYRSTDRSRRGRIVGNTVISRPI